MAIDIRTLSNLPVIVSLHFDFLSAHLCTTYPVILELLFLIITPISSEALIFKLSYTTILKESEIILKYFNGAFSSLCKIFTK